MPSERAGAPTGGTLNREQATMVLEELLTADPAIANWNLYRILDALEACVVPDPRIARLEALIDKAWKTMHAGTPVIDAAVLVTILRGNE